MTISGPQSTHTSQRVLGEHSGIHRITQSTHHRIRALTFGICLFILGVLSGCVSNSEPVSLSFEFSSCLGSVTDEQSCSARVFDALPLDSIGCWMLTSSAGSTPPATEAQIKTHHTLMQWSGETLTPVTSSTVGQFPFAVGERVDMRLWVFDAPITPARCARLTAETACAGDGGCRLRLERTDVQLRAGQRISFQDDLGQCLTEAPQVSRDESCDQRDNDCDGVVDEGCSMISECVNGETIPCMTECGSGIRRCVQGAFDTCNAPTIGAEVCTELGQVSVDEDCDGIFDEGCTTNCQDGETLECRTACGLGVRSCISGSFSECSASQPEVEACTDVGQSPADEDCDGQVDEGCPERCTEGEELDCSNACGAGVRRCVSGAFAGCSAPQPEIEACTMSGEVARDEDCDGQLDEGCQMGGCADGPTRECSNRCGTGQEVCVDGEYQGCNVRQPSVEVCDDQDNDCDESIDEETELGMSCQARVLNCAGVFPGTYSCSSGAPICEARPDFVPAPERAEVCDGLDNNCDGEIDNLPEVGQRCAGEANAQCAYSAYECPEVVMLGFDQALICEADAQPVEVCDDLDNDCDGQVDEDGVCGQLIYQRCSVSLGLATIYGEVAQAPWAQIPPAGDQTCQFGDNRDEAAYSCDTAGAGTNFRALNVAQNNLGHDDWLGIAWDCDLESNPASLSDAEREVLTWARTRCHVALGYRDYYNGNDLLGLQVATCPARSVYERATEFSPRCVQTVEPRQYSALELEGVVNGDDKFAIAFYCDTIGLGVGVTPFDQGAIAERIQSEFTIYFATYQGNTLFNDGTEYWGLLPEDSYRDDTGASRGVRSRTGGGFRFYTVGGWRIRQFGIYTELR